MPKMTGSQMVVKALEDCGVETMFGIPGGQAISLYDAIYDSDINHILVRHEQAASHAADGYARASGKVGVCVATSGPGATNLITGLATANIDSVPVVAITGQVATGLIGSDAFQEADIVGATLPLVKHSFRVTSPDQVPSAVKKAFYIASTGRKGVVLIDVPADVQKGSGEYVFPDKVEFLGYHPESFYDVSGLDEAVSLIEHAKKPVIFAGGGMISSGASPKLVKLAEKLRIPVVTSLLGKGAFPESHAGGLALGMAGMHGQPVANRALMNADVIIAAGARFSDRTTGNKAAFASEAKIIHIDLDPAEIDKSIGSDVWLIGDAGRIIDAISRSVKKISEDRLEWFAELGAMREKEPLMRNAVEGAIAPWQVLDTLRELTNGNAIITTEVGQHQMWAAQYYKVEEPRRFITSGGLGTMGFGFPAAMGAAMARPDLYSCCIAGDGSFMMNIQELDTCARCNIPVKVMIFNNSCLGMVRQWQQLFFNCRYSNTIYTHEPDFIRIAEGMGVKGFAACKPEDIRKTIEAALEVPGPAVIDFRIPQGAMVLPMVPPGGAIDKMILN